MSSIRSLFRGTAVLALVAFAACGKNQSEGEVTTVHGALLPDETTPIGQKWRQLVTAGVPIGEATNTVQNVPGYPATYQTFVQGVIVFTNDHGAVYLTQAIFDKWQSLTTMLDAGGNPVYGFFGVPTADYVTVAGHDDATFTGGMIVVSAGSAGSSSAASTSSTWRFKPRSARRPPRRRMRCGRGAASRPSRAATSIGVRPSAGRSRSSPGRS